MDASVQFLLGIAAHDERCLEAVLSPARPEAPVLGRSTVALVRLAALLALGAETDCVRWAAEQAAASGAGDAAIVQVLLTAGAAAGAAQTIVSAPRLALALDVDVGTDVAADAGTDAPPE